MFNIDFFKSMNLPNKLTVLRLLLTPVLILFMIMNYNKTFFNVLVYLIMVILFILISLTDYIDGYIARRDNLITDFGKLMDPIADKIFVFSILIVLVKYNEISLWLVIILLAREFVVVAIRTLIVEKGGKIVPASDIAKLKTAFQMFAIAFTIILPFSSLINNILMLPAVYLSLLSMVDYINFAKDYIKENNGV